MRNARPIYPALHVIGDPSFRMFYNHANWSKGTFLGRGFSGRTWPVWVWHTYCTIVHLIHYGLRILHLSYCCWNEGWNRKVSVFEIIEFLMGGTYFRFFYVTAQVSK